MKSIPESELIVEDKDDDDTASTVIKKSRVEKLKQLFSKKA